MTIDYLNGKNKLIYGDNLTVMQGIKNRMPSNFVDLIYLDPPFNSNRNYNMMYKTMTGRPVPEQAEAFCDAWTLSAEDIEKLAHLPRIMEGYGMDAQMIAFWENWMKALANTSNALLSYLFYMMQRLFEMRRILKPTGSIYLHCDPTASHYIKVMMDGVFGHQNFRNEITWCYKSRPQSKKHFGKKHDIILLYSKSDAYTFNWKNVVRPLSNNTSAKYRLVDDKGRKYRLQGRGITGSPIKSSKDVHAKWEAERPDLVIRDYLDEKCDVSREDWWDDIDILNQVAKERLGYATQKPMALLERIIKASSNEGDIVFDPFCGCGTAIYASQKLNRQWIGCDIAVLSVKLVMETLKNGKKPLVAYPLQEGIDLELCGYPLSLEGAKLLFAQDPKQFEHWAIEWVQGFINSKQRGDKGVDGRIRFDTPSKENCAMVLSVKGGKHVTPAMVRELRGVMERDDAEMAGLILMEPPTKGMMEEAAQAVRFECQGMSYDRIQILTVKQMTEEKTLFNVPNVIGHKYKEKYPQTRLYL